MNDFVQQAVSALGLDVGTAQSAVGALLKGARDNLPSEDYATLAENIDGVDELIDASPQETSGAEGVQGAVKGVLGRVADALGAEKHGSVGAGALLGLAGLTPEQMPRFVEMFLEYVRERAGADVAGNLISKMSGLLDLKSGDASV